jgi:hypothetical protein
MWYIEHGSTYTQGYHLIFLYIYILNMGVRTPRIFCIIGRGGPKYLE